MKLNIEIDCTPEQFKGIFVPSDKRTDFTAVFFNAMQKSFMKQYFDMGNKTMSKFDETVQSIYLPRRKQNLELKNLLIL